ncbi:DUF5069 domain-containing protein [Nitrospira sp. Nam80]
MTKHQYPRSPKILLGGIAHLARFIDKIRMRHAGLIQDYNYITVGFDKYLIDFLQIDPQVFERRVLAGETDEKLLEWIRHHGRQVTELEIREWSEALLARSPNDEAARRRFQGRLDEIAKNRGVQPDNLPRVTTWADVIEVDEGRL